MAECFKTVFVVVASHAGVTDSAEWNVFIGYMHDYVIDAVDTVTAKIEIIRRAKEVGTKVISCMGTGGKTDPTLLKVADIEKTKGCPLARVMRKELKDRGVKSLKVVYSKEEPKGIEGERLPGSVSFVPSVMGLIIAGEVIKDIALKSV